MEQSLEQLQRFFKTNHPVMIVNTSTDRALLCLNPEFEIHGTMIFMKFESLNKRGGNSIFVKALHPTDEKNTLYLENEEENILMLQALNLANYRHYIQPQYTDTPDFLSLDQLKSHILAQ